MNRFTGALLALALIVVPIAAQAATVEVPIGEWAAAAINFALPLVGAGIIWLLALAQKVGVPYANRLRTEQAEQLLAMAVTYGLNATAGAVKGKAVSVEVGNAVVSTALSYAIANGPSKLIGWLGGEDGIRDKILARLTVPEDAAIQNGEIVPAPKA
ncbi:MAG: hypothetical protein J0I45_16220 [Bosea sp.]|nr:hypothetical protein [Bosea sp. (in: a-proteobacteria)]